MLLQFFKNKPFAWIMAIIAITMVLSAIADGSRMSRSVPFSDFLNAVKAREVQSVKIRGDVVEIISKTGERYETLMPRIYYRLTDDLMENSVKFEVAPTDSTLGSLIGLLLSWFPAFLLAGVGLYSIYTMRGNTAVRFGNSRASDMKKIRSDKRFTDVAGIDEAKQEVAEIVDFLKDPEKFEKIGARIPKGFLLTGSPGVGKTLLAKAIAGEADVPFFSLSGSDFVEMFVGVGASRVRQTFKYAKENAPCIIFIDEIDAVGRQRGVGVGGGNDEREQTLNQLLVEMDGFNDNNGIIVIAATNRPDILDKALLRSGRFDRQIHIPNPDLAGREQILKVLMRGLLLGPTVDIRRVARGTPGFSGADLANLINEAALLSARFNRATVGMEALEQARDRIMMGPERKSMMMSAEEKRITAYHEAGHTIVAIHSKHCDPIHKVTIIPRGRSLGATWKLPERDSYSVSYAKLLDDLAMSMGGRAAETIIFGSENITTGAGGDIADATSVATNMVKNWGLSATVGMVQIRDGEQFVSEDMLCEVDREVRRLMDESYKRAEEILRREIKSLHLLAEALLEYETLSGEDVARLLSGEPLNKEVLDLYDGLNIKKDGDGKRKASKARENTADSAEIRVKDKEALPDARIVGEPQSEQKRRARKPANI